MDGLIETFDICKVGLQCCSDSDNRDDGDDKSEDRDDCRDLDENDDAFPTQLLLYWLIQVVLSGQTG